MNRVTTQIAAGTGVLLALAGTARAQQIVRHPYLQQVTPSSVVIVWTTDVAADSRVSYGASPTDLPEQVILAPQVTQHEVTVTGLTAGTRYYYAVGSANGLLAGADTVHYFETAPTTGTPKKFRAWLVGDSGTGGTRQAQVRDAMLQFAGAYRPHLFLHVGDMAYDTGTTTEFTDHFFAPYETVLRNTVVWPAMGNHEGASSDSQTQIGPYYTAYVVPKAAEAGGLASGTEAYYSFDYGNVHFIVLDSHDTPRDPGGAMLTWMQADLAATNQEWIIAYWHHPPYTKGSHDSDAEIQLIEMRENALPILEAAGVDLVLAGHSHIYERSFLIDGAYATPTTAAGHILDSGDGQPLGAGPYRKLAGQNSHDGAVYIVAGHGGTAVEGAGNHPVMYFSEVNHGSCLLDIQENRLALTNIRWNGDVTDRFSMIKGDGLVLAAPDGGEALSAGASFDIRWATVGNIPNVRLEYSTNDGQSFTPIAASIANTGEYSWTVPSVSSVQMLVRVSSVVDPAVRDESNAGFAIAAPVTVIDYGGTWRYSDDGVDHGVAWLDATFDDAAWQEGPGKLGYGEGDEATVLIDADPNHPSVYFRKVVPIEAPVLQANLEVLHDDGVAIWINGNEVFSKYVDNGTDYATFATTTVGDGEISPASISIAPSPFVIGDNLVAVMVKQISGTSSDLSFDMKLGVMLETPMGAGGAGGAGGSGATGSANGGGPPTGASNGSGGAAGSGESDGGCGCQAAGAPAQSLGWLSVGILALMRRRRERKR
jgi:MYXO-CTERM domain-containing protein